MIKKILPRRLKAAILAFISPEKIYSNETEGSFNYKYISGSLKYDIETFEIFKRVLKKDSNCIDVGCFKGDILKEMLRYSPRGNHFAFEPIPALYIDLLKSFPDNCRFYNLALYDEKGTSSFNLVSPNTGYSGIKKRNYDNPDAKTSIIEVETDLMDNVIPENIEIDLIKIDVEGAELHVLRGAEKIIRKNKPYIIFEHGLGAADFYGTKPEEIYDFLFSVCGLKISLLEYWLGKKQPLNKSEFITQFNNNYNYYFIAYE